MRFSPSSSHLPSPTARTLPRCGFSLAVSGRTMPLAVVSSSSIALTITRSPRGFSFIDTSVGTLAMRVPGYSTRYRRVLRLVLVRRGAPQALRELGRGLLDLGEADHGDGVLLGDRPAVDLFEEVERLVEAPELGVVVLDVARGELLDAL